MRILAVDTSGKSLSLAYCEDSRLIAEYTLQQGYNHSVTQMPMLDDLLKRCEIKPGDIDLFACTEGPGSFTGIRIGVSSVKAMAYAVSKPAVGVSSLEALAAQLSLAPGAYVCPAVDARRGRVFSGLWQVIDRDQNQIMRLANLIKPGNYLAAELASDINDLITEVAAPSSEAGTEHALTPVYLAGDGQEAVAAGLSHVLTVPVDNSGRCIHGYTVAMLAWQKYLSGGESKPQKLLPQYLSPSQAERMRGQQ